PVHHHPGRPAPHQGRHPARAGRDLAAALAGPAGPAHHGRVGPARVPGDFLARHRRAGGHAAGGGGHAEPGLLEGAGRPRGAPAADGGRCRGGRHQYRRVRCVHPERDRGLGGGGQGLRRVGELARETQWRERRALRFATMSDWHYKHKEFPMRLLHTMLRVGNLDKSIDFYTNVLGMRVLRRKDYPDGKFTLAFVGYQDESEGAVIELTHNWDTASYDLGNGYGHIALEVEDAYDACEKVKQKGGKVTRDAGPMKHGTTVIAFVEDPDGYKIEFIQRKGRDD